MIKKIIFFYIFINLFNYLNANPYKIIVTINNDPITQLDLDYEIKILSILNNRDVLQEQINIALNNLIEESIKKKEIKNEKIKIDDNLINNYLLQISKNLNLDLTIVSFER